MLCLVGRGYGADLLILASRTALLALVARAGATRQDTAPPRPPRSGRNPRAGTSASSAITPAKSSVALGGAASETADPTSGPTTTPTLTAVHMTALTVLSSPSSDVR